MTPARVVAVILTAVALLAIAGQAIDTWTDPSPRRWDADSYTGTPAGYRALYELMHALDHDVSRWERPPGKLFEGERRVLLLSPDLVGLEIEKRYLEMLGAWVKDGGELVLASPALSMRTALARREDAEDVEADSDENDDKDLESGDSPEAAHPLREILGDEKLREVLGLGDLKVKSRLGEPDREQLPPTPWGGPEFFEGLRIDLLAFYRRPDTEYKTRAEGRLAPFVEDVDTVHLPARARYLEGSKLDDAAGVLYVSAASNRSSDAEEYPVAALFSQGEGEVLVVSEPVLFSNQSLKTGDNAIAAYRLALGSGWCPVYIDEYYHGVVPRGNMFALLGVYPYGVIGLTIAAAMSLFIWRVAIRFGPPTPLAEGERRSIGEYVEAMSNLFERGQKHRFVLETCRAGVLDEIREALLLPHGVSESVILGRLARTDAQRAHALYEALEASKHVLRAGYEPSLAKVHELQEKFEACRLPHRNRPHTAARTSPPSMNAR